MLRTGASRAIREDAAPLYGELPKAAAIWPAAQEVLTIVPVNPLNAGVAVGYGILGGAVVVVLGILVAASTRGRRPALDAAAVGERERTWFGVVVVALVALLFATIFFTPYGKSSESAPQTLDVHAEQFAFVLDKATVRVGEPVKFHLTSADVNHGFAVFNSRNEFLFQTQVMPGKTTDYVYTFRKPGTYRIVCFEYCGVGHDEMTGTLHASVKVIR
jgi:cytochrome c oxidase subunit 2